MDAFFGLVGLFGSIISLIILIIFAVKKRPLKVISIVFAIFVISFIMGLALPSPEREIVATPDEEIEVVEEAEEAAEKTEEAEEPPKVVEEPKEEVKEEPEVATLKIGDTGQGENWDYTVNSFEVKDKLFGKYGDVAKAGEGQQFLIVNVTFKNIAKETKDMSGFNFRAHASGDLTFDECFGFDLSVTLDKGYTASEDVAPGGSITGDIVFKITAGATDLEFVVGYDDLVWSLQ